MASQPIPRPSTEAVAAVAAQLVVLEAEAAAEGEEACSSFPALLLALAASSPSPSLSSPSSWSTVREGARVGISSALVQRVMVAVAALPVRTLLALVLLSSSS